MGIVREINWDGWFYGYCEEVVLWLIVGGMYCCVYFGYVCIVLVGWKLIVIWVVRKVGFDDCCSVYC